MSSSEKVEIELNGETFLINAQSSIEDLLTELKKKRVGAVAVEINEEIIPRDRYSKTMLNKGDSVEVVTLVGGG